MGKCQFDAETVNEHKDTDGCQGTVPQQNSERNDAVPVKDKCPTGKTNINGKCVTTPPKNSVTDVVQ